MGVLHDGLHWQGEVLHNVAAADGTEMNPEEKIRMIRCSEAMAAALQALRCCPTKGPLV